MDIYVLSFIPPVEGVEAQFNTFRLGLKWSKLLLPGATVLLMDKKAERVFGIALVTEVVTGQLWPLCVEHAARNHRELHGDPAGAAERLFGYLQKLFGPHIAVENKKSTVIYLNRIE